MTRFPKRTLLAVAMGALLAGGAGMAHAVDIGARPVAQVATDSAGRPMHMINFSEPGALYFDGGNNGMRGTSRRATGLRTLDAQSAEVEAYVAFLDSRQGQMIAAIESIIGRTLDVRYNYHYTHNGIGAFLSAAEARLLAGLPGVQQITIDEVYELADERSPQFLGATTLWDGSNSGVTPPIATRGQGIIVGIFDSGMNLAHPSYANSAACGHTPANPKIVRTFDCGTGNCVSGTGNDANGHGSHVAGSAVGNSLTAGVGNPAPDRDISGQAPCAQVINFLVCPTSCPGVAIVAAINTAIALPLNERLSTANFSLGPSLGPNPIRNPWAAGSDAATRALNANNVFVAFAAGNTRGDQPVTIGSVVNVGPWVTTVANSTNDNVGAGSLIDINPGGPQDMVAFVSPINVIPGGGVTALVADAAGAPFNAPEACTSSAASFPPGSMTGRIALVNRGTCAFQEKAQVVQNAGAVAVVLANNAAGPPIVPGGIAAPVTLPVVMLSQADGAASRTFLGANTTATMFVPPPVTLISPAFGNILAASSLRGPVTGLELVKPDITAPGSNNYDAFASPPFAVLSGTSMSSPQIAGGATLIRAIHPNWEPMEVQSAMLLTASLPNQRLPNGADPATPDDVGSGMVDFRRAARAGFVLNETDARFVAANPFANPPGNPRQLNLSNTINLNCVTSCNWNRTIRNTRTNAVNWTVSFVNPANVTLAIDAPTFGFGGSLTETRNLVISATIAPETTLTSTAYGRVIFTPDDASLPPLVMNVVVRGNNPLNADVQFADGFENTF